LSSYLVAHAAAPLVHVAPMDADARSTTARPDRSEGKLLGVSYLAVCAAAAHEAAAHEAALRAAKGARADHTEGKRKVVRLLTAATAVPMSLSPRLWN
jgi:hypothetical protein